MSLVSILGISLSLFKEVPLGGTFHKRDDNGVMSDYRQARDGSLYHIFSGEMYCSEDNSIRVFRRAPMNFNVARDGFSPPPSNPRDLGDLLIQYDAGRTGLFSLGYTRYIYMCSKNSDPWKRIIGLIESGASGYYSK